MRGPRNGVWDRRFPRLLSSCGPWVPDLRSLALARPGHAILVSRASAASALARTERDIDLGLARDRQSNVRKSGKPDLRGPSARSAQHSIEPRNSSTARVSGAAAALAAALLLIFAVSAHAQEAANLGKLSGTLKKVKDSGTITLGYRESSLPFSYLTRRQQPIGYSIDLCREIVEDVSTELDGMEIKIAFVPVTPANRLQKVASGEIDLECGSTTGNVQRRKEVAFSPIFFVAGTKLMVPRTSSVRSYRDLAGKTA